VTLVAILDADKEGFLRSAWSLVQMIGRAARNVGGEVVMYADTITRSMRIAIDETDRRRAVQTAYNLEHGIEPATIVKEIHDINDRLRAVAEATAGYGADEATGRGGFDVADLDIGRVEAIVTQLEAQMKEAARNLEFERAAALRDQVQEIRLRVLEQDASVVVGRAAERAAVRAAERAKRRPTERAGAPSEAAIEVTSVRVVGAGEEPADALIEPDSGTAADWLPGLRDAHDDDGGAPGGWQAGWLDRPTWDPTIAPNIKSRKGKRTPRRRS